MATTEFGNGSVPIAKIEALASELRLLKSGMADMQGRLEALLLEIGSELTQVRSESEPIAEVLPEQLEVEEVQDIAETASEPATAETLPEPEAEVVVESAVTAVSVDAETELSSPGAEEPVVAVAETMVVETTEVATQIETIEPVEIADTTVALDIAVVEPIAPLAKVADAEPVVDTSVVAEEASTVADAAAPAGEAEPVVATTELPVEPVAAEAPVTETSAATLPENVVVLAERRAQPRKARTVIARTARWAAAIALIVMGVAVAATGTGFAGNGDLRVIKTSVCAMAGEACSIVLGMP